jgi:hypothetical protein
VTSPSRLAGHEDHDQRREHDQVERQHHQDRSRRRLAQQHHQHRHAQKPGVADHRALRLHRGLGHGPSPEQRHPGREEVDDETAPEIRRDEPPVEDLRQRQVGGKPEQHRRQREVEDELRQVRRRLGREEPGAAGLEAQRDQREEGQGFQEYLDHFGPTATPRHAALSSAVGASSAAHSAHCLLLPRK